MRMEREWAKPGWQAQGETGQQEWGKHCSVSERQAGSIHSPVTLSGHCRSQRLGVNSSSSC